MLEQMRRAREEGREEREEREEEDEEEWRGRRGLNEGHLYGTGSSGGRSVRPSHEASYTGGD